MRKISLQIESLVVESFHTTQTEPIAGTVAAHQGDPFTGQPDTCGDTCGRSCAQTCPATCDDNTCITCQSDCRACITPGCPGESGYRCTDGTCYWVC